MKTIELLKDMGFSQQQADLFVLVYQYGPKPASTLAKMMGIERTNMYKMLNVLVGKGLIAQTSKQGSKQFFVPDEHTLDSLIQKRKKELASRENSLSYARSELQQLDDKKQTSVPQMRFFEGKSGIQYFFSDMQQYVLDHEFSLVKFFASNTLESQSQSPKQLHEFAKDMFTDLEAMGVRFEAYLGNGILLLEQVLRTYDVQELGQLPAGSSSVQVFVVGEVVWIALFNHVPFGIKIVSRLFADVIHFFFKQMK